jgi:hypothetical protein
MTTSGKDWRLKMFGGSSAISRTEKYTDEPGNIRQLNRCPGDSSGGGVPGEWKLQNGNLVVEDMAKTMNPWTMGKLS